MNWMGASERTAKNWLAGAHGLAGEHLTELMRHSDEVAKTVLALCGRSEVAISLGFACLRTVLVRILTTTDEILGAET